MESPLKKLLGGKIPHRQSMIIPNAPGSKNRRDVDTTTCFWRLKTQIWPLKTYLAGLDIQAQKAMPSHLKVQDLIFSWLFLPYKCTNAIQSWPRKNYMTLTLQHEPTFRRCCTLWFSLIHCSSKAEVQKGQCSNLLALECKSHDMRQENPKLW